MFTKSGTGFCEKTRDNNKLEHIYDSIKCKCALKSKVVISTACITGNDDFSAVFKNYGATVYIAPKTYPDGQLIPLFVIYPILNEKLSLSATMTSIVKWLPDAKDFMVYQYN